MNPPSPTSPAAEAFRAIAARAVAALEESKGQARQAPRIVMES
jgi:hypothetical protein